MLDVQTYRTIDGDVLDAVIKRFYGRGPDALAAVLDANPHIRHAPAVLPAGLEITLPHLPAPKPKPIIQLWD